MAGNAYIFTVTLLAAVAPLACSRSNTRVDFGDLCGGDERRHVRMEGYLRWPLSDNMELAEVIGASYMLLTENPNGTGGFVYVLIANSSVDPVEKVQDARLTTELRVRSDDGKDVDAGKQVGLAGGAIRKGTQCVLKVDSIDEL